jgi:GDPmannose 4,6-dehydratase
MTSIIFGISGQDGYYLKNILESFSHQVIGISRAGGRWLEGDVVNYGFVSSLIETYKPDYIFHLAANSTTNHSALFENHDTISTGTLNILESVKLFSPKTKVFLSGSAMQFKNTGIPINEKTPFEASSPYSIARIQSVYAGRYYRDKFGIQVYTGFFFNHDSPLRSDRHVNKKIITGVKKIIAGEIGKLELGNIKVKKEFNFAGDVVKAIWCLVNQTDVFEAVIGSGIAYSIEDWVCYCFEKNNLNWVDYVILNDNFKPEYEILVCDPQLIKSLGWIPKVDFHQLADLMIQN